MKKLQLAGAVVPVGDDLRVELDSKAHELSGEGVALARAVLEAAREPATPPALERASGLKGRDAKALIRSLREAGMLVEVVPAAERLKPGGTGPLSTALKAQLKGRWVPASLPKTQLAVLGALNAPEWHAALRKLRGPAVSVSVEGATVWAGPFEPKSGTAPCPLCLALRRAAASGGVTPSAGALDVPLAAAQVIAAVSRGLFGSSAEIRRGSLTLHPLVPVASCARCGAKAEGKRAVASVLDFDAERAGPSDDVREAFSDPALGLFELRRHQNDGAFLGLPLVVGGVRAIVRNAQGFSVRAQGSGIFGSGYSAAQRELVAFCEGVERYALVTQRPEVEATPHRALGAEAVAPGEAIPLPRRPYRDDEPLDWAWTMELTSRTPKLLPFDALAVRPNREDPLMDEPFFTGGAVQTTMRRALFRALGECIERDAYLLAYYLQLPLQWIVPNNQGDSGGALARRFLESRGISVAFADLGIDLPLPAVLGVATATKAAGGWPAGGHVFSASSGETEAAAIDRATSELLGQYSALSAAEPGTPLHALGVDPVSGEQPEWWPMFARYLEAGAPMPFTFAAEQPRMPMSGAAPPLEELLAELEKRGLRAYARPLVGPEVEQSGLCAVKVHVPGLLRPAKSRAELAFHPQRLVAVAKKWRVPPEVKEGEHPLA